MILIPALPTLAQKDLQINFKNSIRDAHTPQPGEKVFNTMRYRSGETVKDKDIFRAVSVIKSSK